MSKIKAFSDLQQSKKLAKILSPKSADMFYIAGKGEPVFIGNKMVAYGEDDYDCLGGPDVLCWSLASLLAVLPKYEFYNFGDTIQLDVYREALATEGDETLLDLVVNMIIHLHKLKML